MFFFSVSYDNFFGEVAFFKQQYHKMLGFISETSGIFASEEAFLLIVTTND